MTRMSSITADGLAAAATIPADEQVGPLEQRHLQFANYRAVAEGTKVSKTHWHIAAANALGWGFDGMDGVIFALVSPMVIKEFSLTVPEYRSGLQIALFVGIAGRFCAQRRMVARFGAGGGDLAGAAARTGQQRDALDLVPRSLARRRHHGACR